MAFYALAGSSILATKYLYDYIYTPSTDESTDGSKEYSNNESTEYSNNESKDGSINESKEKSTENIIKNNEEIDMCEITPTLTPQSLAPLPYDKYRISYKKKND